VSHRFSINYNKTHKSRLKYEIQYDLYEISPKNKEPNKNLNLRLWVLMFFLKKP